MCRLNRWGISLVAVVGIAVSGCGESAPPPESKAKTNANILPKTTKEAKKGWQSRQPVYPND